MDQLVYPILTVFATSFIAWLFNRKTIQLDEEIKAVSLLKTLLDDAIFRLNEATKTIHEQDERIKELMNEIERLTEELKKFKQLNGKNPTMIIQNNKL